MEELDVIGISPKCSDLCPGKIISANFKFKESITYQYHYQCERFSYDPYIFNLDMVALFVNKCGFLPYRISNLERYYQGIISFRFYCIA